MHKVWMMEDSQLKVVCQTTVPNYSQMPNPMPASWCLSEHVRKLDRHTYAKVSVIVRVQMHTVVFKTVDMLGSM